MANLTLTRRNFVKLTAATGAVAAVASSGERLVGLAAKEASSAGNASASDTKVIQSACRLCYGRCGLLGHVKDGRVVKIEGDKNNIFSEGTLCSRAFAIPQLLYNPLRITHPMKRVGERGEGKWKRVTWDEALDDIAKNYLEIKEKYGGHTIIHQYGTGRDMHQFQAINKLWLEMGSTATFGVGNLCWVGSYMVSNRIYGDETQYTGWDGQNTKCILIWCRQERSRGYYDWLTIKRAKERGAKVIVVDPRLCSTSAKADIWLPVRPGSDMGLVLCFINTMITEDRYDKDFVKQWTNGPFLVNDNGYLLRESDIKEGGNPNNFVVWDTITNSYKFWNGDALAWNAPEIEPAITGEYEIEGKKYKTSFTVFAESIKEWTFEKAAEVTWVPIERIKEAVYTYLDNSPGACFTRGQKVEFSINTSGISHAFTIMMALAGNFDVKGGQNIAREPATGMDSFMFDVIPPKGELRQHTLANLDKYSICPGQAKVYGEIGGFGAATTNAMLTGKPFQPRAYWGQTSEPIIGVEDSKKVYEGFKNLDFIVNVDLFMTPTGSLADYILPAAHPNEVDRVEWAHSGHGWPASHTYLIRQPFHEPVGECRDDIDICFDLAKRMGIDMGWKDKYQYFDFILRPAGLNFEGFRKQGSITRPPSYRRYETGGLRRDKRLGFQTPNGKFNLYSEDLKDMGWGPLPYYIEQPITPYSRPDLLEEYPYILFTGGRSHVYFHTEYRQSPWLREVHPFPMVEMNPVTAEENGIKDGDWIYIETYHDKCKMKARVTNAIRPGSVHCEHDWWFPEKSVDDDVFGSFECNCNVLIDNSGPYDPAVGTDNFGGLCKIYVAKDGPPKGIYSTPEQLKAFLPEGGKQ